MAKDKARTDIDAAAAGKPKAKGVREDSARSKGVFERGRGPGQHGERRR